MSAERYVAKRSGSQGAELAGPLALPYYLGDGVAPAAFERLALAGRLFVA